MLVMIITKCMIVAQVNAPHLPWRFLVRVPEMNI